MEVVNTMNIKTIVASNATDFDKLVSDTSDLVGGKFTQTHVGHDVSGRPTYFTAIIFYED